MSAKLTQFPPFTLATPASLLGGSSADRLFDGMVPNYPNTRAGGDWVGDDAVWSWPKLGFGQALTRRQISMQPRDTTTTLDTLGVTAPTQLSPGAVKVSSRNADGNFLRYQTLATTASVAGINTFTSGVTRREVDPYFVAVIRTPATITSMRIWAGLFSATPAASSDPTLHGVGFRFDTGVSTAWRYWSNDGVSGGTTSTGPVVTASTRYELALCFLNSTTVGFFIDGQLTNTISSQLPSLTQSLNINVSVTALSASARTLDISRIALHCR